MKLAITVYIFLLIVLGSKCFNKYIYIYPNNVFVLELSCFIDKISQMLDGKSIDFICIY